MTGQSGNPFFVFMRLIGIHPLIAVLMIIVDAAIFGTNIITAGSLIWVTAPAGVVIGILTSYIQVREGGDPWIIAIVKGLILGLLTLIPTPLGTIFANLGWAIPGLIAVLGGQSGHARKQRELIEMNRRAQIDDLSGSSTRTRRPKAPRVRKK